MRETEEKARARQGEPWSLRYLAGCGGSGLARPILCGLPGTSAPRLPGTLRPGPRPCLGSDMQPFSGTGEGQRRLGTGWGGCGWALGFVWVPCGEEGLQSGGGSRPEGGPADALARRGVRPGARARTRWIVCGLWPQTEQSGLRGGGQPLGRQPDVESVGRTLRSVWCLGCRGAAAQSVERAVRGARRSAWARQQAQHTSAAARPCPGRLHRGRPVVRAWKINAVKGLSFFFT